LNCETRRRREDQDTEVACRLDESGRGDRLAGRGGMSEAVTPRCARIRAREVPVGGLVLDVAGVDVLVCLVLGLDGRLGDGAVARAVPVPVSVAILLRRALGGRDELREHSGERVGLMSAKLGSGCGVRRILREDALEAEHEPVAHLPAGRRLGEARVDLRECVVERVAPPRTRRERLQRVLPRMEERLAEPRLGAARRGSQVLGCVRRQRRDGRRLVHSGSTFRRAAPS
jgi:hypothetical protein